MGDIDLEKKAAYVKPATANNGGLEAFSGSSDSDMRQDEVGYAEDLQRNFSLLSLIGIAFCMSNSWFGISSSLVTGISSGGTVLIVYGLLWISLLSLCIGSSLSELASAMPNSGGQYYWTSMLAPKRFNRFFSYITGWFGYAGAIFACASVCLSLGQGVVGMWQLGHPDLYVFIKIDPNCL